MFKPRGVGPTDLGRHLHSCPDGGGVLVDCVVLGSHDNSGTEDAGFWKRLPKRRAGSPLARLVPLQQWKYAVLMLQSRVIFPAGFRRGREC